MPGPSPDFVSFKHVGTRIYFNGNVWLVKIRTLRVTEDAVEVTDHVGGEQRARYQKLCNGFEADAECYDDGSSQLLTNFFTNQQNEDARLPQLPLAAGMRFNYLDGSAFACKFTNCTLSPMQISMNGANERVMHRVKWKSQYFDATPAA